MMKRTRLRFENIQQIVGSEESLSVIILTDETRQRALTVVCDEPMSRQILMRLQNPTACRILLPESLIEMMPTDDYELTVFGLHDGQYQVVLANSDYSRTKRMRMSDAVLLTLIDSKIPLYIEEKLMDRQSVAFEEKAQGIAIPINTMDSRRLSYVLQQAIEQENYELASQIRDEINRRKGQA
jgi:hypothetical protein